ncbi:MAG: hypothetical protein RLP16_05535 [Alphaproteobacteria bacterium]
MLMVSPYMERRLARRKRDAVRGRFGNERFDTLTKEIVALHRLAREAGMIASIFGLEGPLRAAVRADLCRQGWRWRDADLAARTVLDEVYRRLRAERPDWNEGQPEHVALPGLQIERTRCIRCHKKLTGEQTKFCSTLCATSHHSAIRWRKECSEEWAMKAAANWT